MSGTTDDKGKARRPPRAANTGGIYKPKGSRFYWVNYVSGGKRFYESTKSELKGDATKLLNDRLGDAGKGIAVSPKMGKLTLRDGLAAVVHDMRMNARDSVVCSRCKIPCCGVPEHSNLIQRQIDLHILRKPGAPDDKERGYFNGDRRMSSISTSDLTSYVAHRLAQSAAAASVNHELATIRRAFRLAVRGHELATMPHVPMLTLDNARKGFFERHEFEAVLKHLPAYLHAPLTFAFVTGWRLKSEVLPLTVDRVDLRTGVVRLDVGTTKSGEGRTFYMTTELRDVLTAQFVALEDLKSKGIISPYVFHRPDGSRLKDFRGAWQKACETAGHPGKLFHDFRRTAVRNLERAAVPRSTAMAMVGHKTESIYRRYAIVDEQMHREAAAKLDAWNVEQQAKADAERKGQVKRFKKRDRKRASRAS
jgi:integrase